MVVKPAAASSEDTLPFRSTTATRSRAMIECAQCGEALYLPEWSEYRHKNSVRHLWKCEACDHTFETTVRFEQVAA
jgi:hypothetical protein